MELWLISLNCCYQILSTFPWTYVFRIYCFSVFIGFYFKSMYFPSKKMSWSSFLFSFGFLYCSWNISKKGGKHIIMCFQKKKKKCSWKRLLKYFFIRLCFNSIMFSLFLLLSSPPKMYRISELQFLYKDIVIVYFILLNEMCQLISPGVLFPFPISLLFSIIADSTSL